MRSRLVVQFQADRSMEKYKKKPRNRRVGKNNLLYDKGSISSW